MMLSVKPTRLDILFFVVLPIIFGISTAITFPLMLHGSGWWALIAIPSLCVCIAFGLLYLIAGMVLIICWIGGSRWWKTMTEWLDKEAW